MDSIMGVFGGGSAAKAQKEAKRAAEEARAQQAQTLKAQEAVQARARQTEDRRAEDLSKESAALRRAITARRNGRNALAYGGPTTTLKTTLGG